MSVDKLSDCSKIILQQNPFTQISNEIIFNIKDNDAFRVFCYLQAKSQNWKVIKEDVKKQCGIGYRKLDQIFSYLNRANLIQYIKITDSQGKFVRFDVHVLNGIEFNINEPFKKELSTPALSAPAVSVTCGNAQLLNKEITKERNKREPARKKRVPLPPDFVFEERVIQVCKEVSKKVGLLPHELLNKFKLTVKDRAMESADWNASFEKFLITERPSVKNEINQRQEMRSTVPWFKAEHANIN